MKKLICICLAAILLLAACTPEGGVSEPEVNVSGEESIVEQPSYDLTKDAVDKMLADRTDAINGDASREGDRINRAEGKKYTTTSASESFVDKNYLTDGDYNATHFKYVKKGWMGITESGTEIVIDLGEKFTDLCDFEASSCRNTQYGVDMCDAMFVYISEDGESWKNIGIYEYNEGLSDKARHTMSVNLRGTVSARYVKFVFEGLNGETMVFDEIAVYSYGEVNDSTFNGINTYYGAVPVPVIKDEKYFASTESDYNTHQNLLLGLPVLTYEALTDVQTDLVVASYNTLPSTGLLTDGKYASRAEMGDSKWFRNTHGTGRVAVFDLGAIASIDSVKAGFLASHGPGIKIPATFAVSASLDGNEWFTVYEEKGTSTATSARVEYGGDFDKAYKARYVKISFSITAHVYLDEFEVFGTKNATDAAHPSETSITAPTVSSGYGTSEQYDGMHDVVLSYLLPNSVKVTKDQYLAYVAYIEDGEIKDTYFDGFMYLPYVSYLYSGGTKKQLTKEEWQAFIDWQFMEGYNFDALDAAVDETKEALDLDDDYSVGTYLSLFYPVMGATNFGELNGKQMNFNNIEDRKAVLKWFVDEQIRAFEAKGYDSVRLSGFYWFVEEMSGSDPHVQELCNYICDYIRSLGYQTTWIPYFNASGNTSWRDFGFDTACLQPNYAFNEEVPLQRIYDAAAIAKLYGMSIEIEIQDTSDVKWVERYRSYLYVGAEIGFMKDCVHMYYLAGMPGAIYNAFVSTNPAINVIYKETYLFIKGRLGAPEEAPQGEDAVCKAGESVTGTITLPTSDIECSGLRLSVSAEHGTVAVMADGTFIYTPFEGFTGEDYFEVVADYGVSGQSGVGRINITVE